MLHLTNTRRNLLLFALGVSVSDLNLYGVLILLAGCQLFQGPQCLLASPNSASRLLSPLPPPRGFPLTHDQQAGYAL